MNIRILCAGVILVGLLSSCASKKNTLTYFQDIDVETLSVPVSSEQYEPKIEPSDELLITVSSVRPQVSAMYNLPMINPAAANSGFVTISQPQQATYMVSGDGDITMPILGKIHVAGKTVLELENYLTELVSKDVEDPVVIVRILNYHVNVGGEVRSPGTIKVNVPRFSIIDALAASGDLTEYGDRSNIIIVREENGKREAHKLDLTSADIFSSPYFFLKQNDYVYVSPNIVRSENAKYNTNNSYKLSVISTVVSGVSVIATLVIALVLK